MLLCYAAIMGASQLIFVNASKQFGSNYSTEGLVHAFIYSYWLYIAITFYVVATGFWMFLLYRIDIRLAYPIASTSIIFAALLQTMIDGKMPSLLYWLGIAIVIGGLGLINASATSA